MERESQQRLRRGQIERAILGTLVAAGAVATAVVAPNMLQILKHIDPDWLRKRDPRQRLYETASRLKRKGLVQFVIERGRTRMRLTAKGKAALERQIASARPLRRPKRWDRRWRIIIFDIPETRRLMRDRVRGMLSEFGFVRLQNSVWIYPFDCEEIITLLKTELGLGRSMLYIIADAVEFDKPLRRQFKLPLV